jgi:hypothetical protein
VAPWSPQPRDAGPVVVHRPARPTSRWTRLA